jgi:hypothetical protein
LSYTHWKSDQVNLPYSTLFVFWLSLEDDDDEMNNNIRYNGMASMLTGDHTSRPIPTEGWSD